MAQLSNKKIRELILENYSESDNVAVSDILKLFESKSGGFGGEKSAVEVDGVVIGKKDAKTGLYYGAECFTARAQSSDGLGYYTKATQSALNKLRREKSKAKDEADAQLRAGEIDVEEWNSKLDEIEAMGIDIDALTEGGYETAEALIEAYNNGELTCPSEVE